MRQSTLDIVPITLRQAKEFVGEVHRHHGPPVGHRFSVGVENDEGELVGVAVMGRPVARAISQTKVLEVTRVATTGWPNACSALYGAACRIHKAHGFNHAITYTLASEPGTSLVAAGWKPVAYIRGRSWDTPSRRRGDVSPTDDKVRWECRCGPTLALSDFPRPEEDPERG